MGFVKVHETIDKLDQLRPNAVPEKIKRDWLAQLDGTLRQQLIVKHEPKGSVALGEGADKSEHEDAILLVPKPFEEIYMYWLCAQIDFSLGEITRYSNSMALYNMAMLGFTAVYKSGYRPLPRGQFLL